MARRFLVRLLVFFWILIDTSGNLLDDIEPIETTHPVHVTSIPIQTSVFSKEPHLFAKLRVIRK
jgi:hypothetical protein